LAITLALGRDDLPPTGLLLNPHGGSWNPADRLSRTVYPQRQLEPSSPAGWSTGKRPSSPAPATRRCFRRLRGRRPLRIGPLAVPDPWRASGRCGHGRSTPYRAAAKSTARAG